ncbi:MAG TPA: DM13 domain-containing protein [Roseiflexaceae bacterium]|nr:DM13 domain-containing protein [Roseiflexaceae bacterium]
MTRFWSSIDVRWRWLGAAFIAIIVLPLAWYLGSPLFINVTVDERFPDVAPISASTSLPAVAAPQAVPRATALAAEPIQLGKGQFTEVDAIHKGEGTATLFRLPDERRLIRFETFKVQNGPDLYVYLSGHPMPRSSEELHNQSAFEVGRLKGNIGDQNYELPADLDLSQYHSVVIYCKRFGVVFSTAELIASQ